MKNIKKSDVMDAIEFMDELVYASPRRYKLDATDGDRAVKAREVLRRLLKLRKFKDE